MCSRRPNTSYQGFSKARLWGLYVSWSTLMTSPLVSLTPLLKCSLTTLSCSDSSKNADEILMKTLNVYPLRWIKLNGPSVKHTPRSVSTWSLVHHKDLIKRVESRDLQLNTRLEHCISWSSRIDYLCNRPYS